jgi:hypothetical protein
VAEAVDQRAGAEGEGALDGFFELERGKEKAALILVGPMPFGVALAVGESLWVFSVSISLSCETLLGICFEVLRTIVHHVLKKAAGSRSPVRR